MVVLPRLVDLERQRAIRKATADEGSMVRADDMSMASSKIHWYGNSRQRGFNVTRSIAGFRRSHPSDSFTGNAARSKSYALNTMSHLLSCRGSEYCAFTHTRVHALTEIY